MGAVDKKRKGAPEMQEAETSQVCEPSHRSDARAYTHIRANALYILSISHVRTVAQDLAVCHDCQRKIPRENAIAQKGLIFCAAKEDCQKHLLAGGRGCRRRMH
jgi:hypothetical protein